MDPSRTRCWQVALDLQLSWFHYHIKHNLIGQTTYVSAADLCFERENTHVLITDFIYKLEYFRIYKQLIC